jgi:hypothetical protein
VPVGTLELQAWHALYGLKTAQVTVEVGKTAAIEFAYAAADAPGQGDNQGKEAM